ESRELTHAKTRGVKKFEKRAVAPKEQGLSVDIAACVPHGACLFLFPVCARSRRMIWWPKRELIQKAVHFFGRQHGRDAFRQLGSGNQTGRIFLKRAFANAELEKGTQRGKLARDRALFQFVRVKMSDVFANDLMGDVGYGRCTNARRTEVRGKLLEVFSVVQHGVRRGISH